MLLVYEMDKRKQELLLYVQKRWLSEIEISEIEEKAWEYFWEVDLRRILTWVVEEYKEFLDFSVKMLKALGYEHVVFEEGDQLSVGVFEHISPVIYAFLTLPHLRPVFPDWEDRPDYTHVTMPLKRADNFVRKYTDYLKQRAEEIHQLVVERRLRELEEKFAK